jgi:hypothetical protein
MSNPWDAQGAEEYAGLGAEFVLETTVDEQWAIPLVQSLVAFNMLVSAGRCGDRPLLAYSDGIPQTIEPNFSNVILGVPTSHPAQFCLVSGKVDLLQIVGITKDEFEFAKQFGTPAICQLLQEQGAYPVSNARRTSIVLPDERAAPG